MRVPMMVYPIRQFVVSSQLVLSSSFDARAPLAVRALGEASESEQAIRVTQEIARRTRPAAVRKVDCIWGSGFEEPYTYMNKVVA